jgi:DNA-binding transcriptional MerR regulator
MDHHNPRECQIPDKLYFKIGEVSDITGLAPSVLRFWESEFLKIKPKRSSSGQRMYRKRDVLFILEIKMLLHEKKFTIQGAKQHLSKRIDPPRTHLSKKTIEEIRKELRHIRDLLS